MSDQSKTVVQTLHGLLDESNYTALGEFCISDKNQDRVSENGWDILSTLVNHLKTSTVDKQNMQVFQDVFNHVAKTSNPKELILGILEQFDPMIILDVVEMLLLPLKIVLDTLMHSDKNNHCYNLNMVFSSLVYYCESLNVPTYEQFDPLDDQKELLEELKIARYIEKCIDLARSTLDIVRDQFSKNIIHATHLKAVKEEAMLFVCGLMERISVLNIIHKEENESNKAVEEERHVEKTAQNLMFLAMSLHPAWNLWQNQTWKSLLPNDRRMVKEELDKITNARACVLYTLCANSSLQDQLPQVMNVKFAFACCIPAILMFLKATNPTQVHKGLAICRFVTNRLEPLSIQRSYLIQESKAVHIQHPAKSLLEAAVTVATQCPAKTLRQRSAQFLTKFVDKFVWSDRFYLVFHLINTVEHGGVVGLMTGYFKDKLSEILQNESPVGSDVFLKPNNFEKLVQKCIALPLGSETDLLSEYDRIMASLNLLRFLLLRDTKNKTGIWKHASNIESQFLNLLRTDINLSRMHFREELKKQSMPAEGKNAPTPEFTINGVSLPSLPPKHRVQMLQSAIHSFDMMQAVCIRVQEIMDKRPIELQTA